MSHGDIAVFAPKSGRDFGGRVCSHLRISLSPHEERAFEDGEHKTRPLESVRGKDVFVIQTSTATPKAIDSRYDPPQA